MAMERMKYIRTDKNGTKIFADWTCPRCGGAGESSMWLKTGKVCFRCGGSGLRERPVIVKEYTDEYAEKLKARRLAKKAKYEEEHAEEIAAAKAEKERMEAERIAEEARQEAERLAEIERNRGHFIGQVGDKIEAEVTLDHNFWFERPCYGAPWKMETVNGYEFKTDDGNTLIWMTTGKPLFYTEADGRTMVFPEDGERMKIKGTIKEHKERNNVNQTMLTRVKWVR